MFSMQPACCEFSEGWQKFAICVGCKCVVCVVLLIVTVSNDYIYIFMCVLCFR